MERPVENARSLFDYDAGQPPGVRATGIDVTIRNLAYQAAPERWVRAYLVTPAREEETRSAAVLFLHPGPGSRATFLAEAVALAGMGAVSLLVDAPWAADTAATWGQAVTDPEEAVREHIRTVIDLRRGLDLLIARPNVDSERIGFVGHSFGALIGAVLAGVDRRLAAAVLMAGTGRFADVAAVNLPDLQGERLERYRRTLAEIDPAVWVGRAGPAALLFQSALHDEVITEEQSREFFERASDPKSLEWYDAGHYLDEEARRDRIAWLGKQLSLERRKPDGSGSGSPTP
ncbi:MULTISPECIES: alpha/beta hydrolase [unclassified Methanoculleus]|uniref:alpha/beta hydrolase n=1 Tax=unclassified Methanoculleus TaxID=2619537 RepID=UPI0025F21766|nr:MULTISPECIES: acyl-CoA thioester hydrolase/BAAT C-terminal domain-containing protein [unclassified Methanoculleus]